MAESSSLWTTKQRIRHLDLPIKNFVENAIPYQVETLKTLKSNLAKVSVLCRLQLLFVLFCCYVTVVVYSKDV